MSKIHRTQTGIAAALARPHTLHEPRDLAKISQSFLVVFCLLCGSLSIYRCFKRHDHGLDLMQAEAKFYRKYLLA